MNMDLLNQEVLKNLLVRLWNFIGSKENGIKQIAMTADKNWNFHQVVIDEIEKPQTDLKMTKQAICSIVKDYFNQFLTNQISNSRLFNKLFELRVIAIVHPQVKQSFGTNITPLEQQQITAKRVVDFFLHNELKKILDSFTLKNKAANTLAFIDTTIILIKDLEELSYSSNYAVTSAQKEDFLGFFLLSILENREDPYLNVDILMTQWIERRKREYSNFFIDFKSQLDNSTDKEFVKNNLRAKFRDFRLSVGRMIKEEHLNVCKFINQANLHTWFLNSEQKVFLNRSEQNFLYLYMHQNYDTLKQMPTAYSRIFLPEILKNYHNLKGKFIFSDFKEMEYKLSKDTNRILISFLSSSMNTHSILRKRNSLFNFYCKNYLSAAERAAHGLNDEEKYKKIGQVCQQYFKGFMDDNILNGAEPISLFAYSIAQVFYKSYIRAKTDMSNIDDLNNLEMSKKIIEYTQQMIYHKNMAAQFFCQLMKPQMQNLTDYQNCLLIGFYTANDNNITLSSKMSHIRVIHNNLNAAPQFKIFGVSLSHFEVIDKFSTLIT